MQRMFNRLDALYLHKKCLLMDRITKDQSKNQSSAEINKNEQRKKARNKRKEGTSNPSPKKNCFVNKTTQTIRETSNTSNSNFNANIP